MQSFRFSALILSLFLLASCTDGPAEKKAGSGPLLLDWQVQGAEGQPYVTCLFQFKRSADGPGAALPAGTTLRLDGADLATDSAGHNGVYYEALYESEGFAGRHELTFTDAAGSGHTVPFTYAPVTLEAAPASIPRNADLRLVLGGLPDSARVMITLIDTAFETDDLSDEFTVRGGELVLPAAVLSGLKPGPLVLDLAHELRLPVQAGPHRGALRVSYGLRRDLQLQ
jgi:hypothetical protein